MKFSIIILLVFENENLVNFVSDVNSKFKALNEDFEILVVSNGLGKLSEEHKGRLAKVSPNLRMYHLPTKTTEAVCLSVGFHESSGDTIVVYGSFQQVSTESVLQMAKMLGKSADLVTPFRKNRRDSKLNQFQSKIYNWLIKALVKSSFSDIGCKVKVLKRRVLEEIDLYGNMYSFLPILAQERGFRAVECKCDHFKDHKESAVRRLNLYFAYLLDIITLFFNARFNRKPLRFFSSVGLIFLLLGMLIFSYVFFEKMIFGILIGERSVLLLSLLFAVLGIQAASVGLLGEVIAFAFGRHRKEYTIEKML
jgi:hypothetical protein